MTRTDVHSPTNLVTEDYEYIFSEVNHVEGVPGWVMRRGDWGMGMSRRIAATDKLGRGTHQCHHCGRHINYFAVLEHTPTGDLIVVGEQCLANRFELATADFQRLRKAAQLDRNRQRIKNARLDFVQANPDLAWLNDDELPEVVSWNSFAADVFRKFHRYGELSDKQVNAVRRVYEGSVRQQEKRLAEKAQENWIPVPIFDDRVEVTGTILSTKWVEGDGYYSEGSLKMLFKVETDAGNYKLWTTVPSKVKNYDKGQRLTLRLRIERSDDDEFFGFGKRPHLVKEH